MFILMQIEPILGWKVLNDRSLVLKQAQGNTKIAHSSILMKNYGNKLVLIMKGFEKIFQNKSSDIKTWRLGDDMSPLSNANYNKFNGERCIENSR